MAFNQGFGTFGANSSTVAVPNFRKTAINGNPNQEPFDISKTDLFKNSSATANQQLSGELPGWNEQSNISREAFQAAQAANQKAKREAIVNSGMKDSGKFLEEGVIQPAAEQQRQTMDFERNLLAERATQARQQQASGQQAAGNLLGYLQTQGEGALNRASQERIAAANLDLENRRIDETARQFNITDSREKQQFADTLKKDYDTLSMQEKQYMLNYGLDRDKFNETKNQFSLTYGLEQQKLLETARQFNITDSREASQFADILKKDYATLDQNQKQFLMNIGLDEAKFNETKNQFTQNLALEREKLASQEKIAQSQLNLDAAKLNETSRQFNISTQQANDQFLSNMKFNYDSLSQDQKKFMESLGFDKEKFEQAKQEFQLNYELSKQLQTKDLDLKEQEIANNYSLATSRLDFDKMVQNQNLDEAQKDRIWNAIENDKKIAADKEVQQMVIANDQWKQMRTEELTKLGWDQDSIQKSLDRQQSLVLANMQNNLTREIEAGRITQQEADRVESARQFNNSQDWLKAAKQMDLDEAQAQRIWSTKERISAEAFKQQESTFQAQLEKELASGTWVDANGNTVNSMQAKQLIEQARQFDSELEWTKEAERQGFSTWDAKRAYEKSQKIEDQQFQSNLETLRSDLAMKGIKYNTVMNYLQTLDPDQAGDILEALAMDSNISYIVKDNEGNPLKDSAGNIVTKKGFPPTKSNASQKGFDVMQQLEKGELSYVDFRGADNPQSSKNKEYMQLFNTVDVWKPNLSYDSGGFWSPDKRYINNAPAKDTVFKYGDRIYQVTADKVMNKSGEDSDEFKVIDIASGLEKTVKVTGKKGSQLQISGL